MLLKKIRLIVILTYIDFRFTKFLKFSKSISPQNFNKIKERILKMYPSVFRVISNKKLLNEMFHSATFCYTFHFSLYIFHYFQYFTITFAPFIATDLKMASIIFMSFKPSCPSILGSGLLFKIQSAIPSICSV